MEARPRIILITPHDDAATHVPEGIDVLRYRTAEEACAFLRGEWFRTTFQAHRAGSSSAAHRYADGIIIEIVPACDDIEIRELRAPAIEGQLTLPCATYRAVTRSRTWYAARYADLARIAKRANLPVAAFTRIPRGTFKKDRVTAHLLKQGLRPRFISPSKVERAVPHAVQQIAHRWFTNPRTGVASAR